MHIDEVFSNLNINQAFPGHLGGVELVQDVILVAVLVLVLLRGGHGVPHAALCAKTFSVVFPNRVLFFFYSFARTPPYEA